MLEAERPRPDLASLDANRAVARLRLSVKRDGEATRIADLAEGGGYRIKFPVPDRGIEAVIINTGGGLLGGDSLSFSIEAEPGTELMVTTQSAEKIYRAAFAAASIDVALTVGAGASLHWLPLEAILFSGAKLTRRIEADVAKDGELMVAESAVFGRLAMGEVLRTGLLADRWRIRRDGRLVYADDVRFDGDISALLDKPALGGGARAAATFLLIAPDAENRLELARSLIENCSVSGGASAWDGKLVVRLLSPDPEPLRNAMIRLAAGLTRRQTPRFW